MVKISLDLKEDAEIIAEIAEILEKYNKLPSVYEIRQLEYHYKELVNQPVFPKVNVPTVEKAPPTPQPEPVADPRIVRIKELLAKSEDELTVAEYKELQKLMPEELKTE